MRLLIVLLLTISQALAAETYIQINGTSIHNKPGYNQFNYGVGIEHFIADQWTIAGGWYQNSEYRGSAYGYARYAVYKNGLWDLGIGVGAVTGYSSYKVAPMLFPQVCYSYLCAIAIPQIDPNGASALAANLRIPIN